MRGLEAGGWGLVRGGIWGLGAAVAALHDVVVAGDAGDEAVDALYRAAAGPLVPGAVVTPVPAAGPADRLAALAPSLAEAIPDEEQLRRVLPVIRAVGERFPQLGRGNAALLVGRQDRGHAAMP